MRSQDRDDGVVGGDLTRRGALAAGVGLASAVAAPTGPASASTAAPQPLTGRTNPQGRFAGKVVLVTGATYGIGRTTTEAFAREGAAVAFCGRTEALGREVEAGIRANGGEAAYVRADVREPADVERFVGTAVGRYGRLDIAFNNAGYFMEPSDPGLRPGPLHEATLEHWAAMMDTNARGVFLAMRREIPAMLAGGGGVIVNMASVSGHAAFAGMGAYAALKHAVVGLTKVAAVELADKNIRVNSISPLGVDTPMARESMAFFGRTLEQVAANAPLKRLNTTGEMARAVMFLASEDASSMTGMDLDVTGSFLAK